MTLGAMAQADPAAARRTSGGVLGQGLVLLFPFFVWIRLNGGGGGGAGEAGAACDGSIYSYTLLSFRRKPESIFTFKMLW